MLERPQNRVRYMMPADPPSLFIPQACKIRGGPPIHNPLGFQSQHPGLNMVPMSAAEHGNNFVDVLVGRGNNFQMFTIHKALICAVLSTVAAYFSGRSPLSICMPLERFQRDEFNVLYNWLYTGRAAIPAWLNVDTDSTQYHGLWERVWVLCQHLEITELKTLAWWELDEYSARNWETRYDR